MKFLIQNYVNNITPCVDALENQIREYSNLVAMLQAYLNLKGKVKGDVLTRIRGVLRRMTILQSELEQNISFLKTHLEHLLREHPELKFPES